MLRFQVFFHKNKSVIFHFFIFLLIIVSSFVALWKMTNLDLFDFFNVLFKITNLYIVLAIVIIVIAIITLFSGLKKIRHDQKKLYREVQRIKETDQKHFEIAEENRKMLIEKMDIFTQNLHYLTGTVKKIDWNITVKLFNHLEIDDKLKKSLETVNFERIENPDAKFVAFFEKFISKIANYVRKLKENNIRFDFKTQKKFKHEIIQLLIADGININKEIFSDLLNKLIIDFIDEKRTSKGKDTVDIISDKFKIFVEDIYVEYIESYKKGRFTQPKVSATDLIGQYKDKLILADDPKEIIRINQEISRLENID